VAHSTPTDQKPSNAPIFVHSSAGRPVAARRQWHWLLPADKLPPRAAAVATKSPAVIAMAGAQTTINNQLKLAAAMATETMTMTAMTKNEKEDDGGGGGSLAAARQQRGGSAATARWWQWRQWC
jgi:hypothetical protein